MAHLQKVEVLVHWTVTVSKTIVLFSLYLEKKIAKVCLPTAYLLYLIKIFLQGIQGIWASLFDGDPSLWAHRKVTATAPEELLPLEKLRCDHQGVEIGLTSSLKALTLGDPASVRQKSILMGKANPAWLAECKTWWKRHPDWHFFLTWIPLKWSSAKQYIGLASSNYGRIRKKCRLWNF